MDKLDHYFSRARSLTLVTARNPAFREFYEAPGERRAKVDAGGRAVRQANEALAYLEELFAGQHRRGVLHRPQRPRERARREGRDRAAEGALRRRDAAPSSSPASPLRPGEVYQAQPVHLARHERVGDRERRRRSRCDGRTPAIVHFEVTLESFRQRGRGERAGDFDIAIVEAKTGKVIVDSRYPQPAGAKSQAGAALPTSRFARIASIAGQGLRRQRTIDDRRQAERVQAPRAGAEQRERLGRRGQRDEPAAPARASFGLLELAMAAAALAAAGLRGHELPHLAGAAARRRAHRRAHRPAATAAA